MRSLIAAGAEVWAVAPVGARRCSWETTGIRFRPYALNARSLAPTEALRNIAQLRRAFVEIRPDLVHTFTAKANTLGTFAARLSGVPHIVNSVTGIGSFLADRTTHPVASTAIRGLYAAAGRLADRVVFQNADDMALFTTSGMTPARKAILIRSSGVNLEEFAPADVSSEMRAALRRSLGIDESGPVVTMIARLIGDKGVREFAEAARHLSGTHKATFLLVGDPDPGNPSSLPSSELASLRAAPTPLLLGHRDDVRELLAITDVFVLPSYREGAPRTVLEAMAMGLPVVTTDVPGCRDAVEDGVNGFLVQPRDVATLADRMACLLDDPAARARFGRVSRQRVEERFTESFIVDAHLDLYETLMRSGRMQKNARGKHAIELANGTSINAQ